jgi:hypothetical protein
LTSKFPKAAFIPPAAKDVCASFLGRFPKIITLTPFDFTSIAALNPAPPHPITSIFVVTV